MGEARVTCGACGAVVDTESGSDLCPACGSSGLVADSTRASDGSRGWKPPASDGLPESIPLELVRGRKLVNERFTLIKPLGRGGMGEVWLATDANLRTHSGQVALKFLTPHFRRNARAMDLLREELEASRQLSHDNIVRIHDLHTPRDEPPFILMEYVEGKTLQQIMRNRTGGRFDWEELKPLVGQLCSALRYAHSKRVIHRDLKPGNLLVDEDLRLKLADFGLARLAPLAAPTGVKTRVAGTPEFMSPQQMGGQAPSVADDIYALGATLYELLTGTCPVSRGEGFAERLESQVPERIAQRLLTLGVDATVPGYVEEAVAACLEKEPSRRPPTVASLEKRLRLVAAPHGEKPPVAIPVPPTRAEEWESVRVPEPSGWGAWVYCAVVLLGLVWVAWKFWPPVRLVPKVATPGTSITITNGPPQEPESPIPFTARPRVMAGLNVRLDPVRWPWPVAEVRFTGVDGAVKGASVTHLVRRTAEDDPNANPLVTIPGRYVIQAGPPGIPPSFSNWINVSAELESGRPWSVPLGYPPPKKWEFYVEGGQDVLVYVRDYWDHPVELLPFARSSEKPVVLTKEGLRRGEFRVTVLRNYRERVTYTNDFNAESFRSSERPFFRSGPAVREPVLGLSWTNSIGLVLMPVGMNRFWAAATETTVTQYWRFTEATGPASNPPPMLSVSRNGWQALGRTWQQPWPEADRGPHAPNDAAAPVVGVSHEEATGFCRWLTARERETQCLKATQEYRLPTNEEWGLLALEDDGRYHPYPWGADHPPPRGEGNYAGKEVLKTDYDPGWPVLDENNYDDPYPRTAPVWSGRPNPYGLYHVGGNVAEWCSSSYRAELNPEDILNDDPYLRDDGGGERYRVVRGGSWYDGASGHGQTNDLRTCVRRFELPTNRCDRIGFRVVLVERGGEAKE